MVLQRLDDEIPHEQHKTLTTERERSRKARQRTKGHNVRKHARKLHTPNCINEHKFMSSINECGDVLCAVCRKLLHARQRCKLEKSFRVDPILSMI